MQAEADITESLFADMNVNANQLNSVPDYTSFGKKVAGVLYEGKAPYNLHCFFSEITRDMGKHLDSKRIKKILDQMTTMYNEKVKEEKDKDKPKKSQKATLKGGKNQVNTKMMDDLMGDDYDSEEDDGTYKGKARAEEEDYDFM